jgi:hypothetical protein
MELIPLCGIFLSLSFLVSENDRKGGNANVGLDFGFSVWYWSLIEFAKRKKVGKRQGRLVLATVLAFFTEISYYTN